jgi:hypothetical protein
MEDRKALLEEEWDDSFTPIVKAIKRTRMAESVLVAFVMMLQALIKNRYSFSVHPPAGGWDGIGLKYSLRSYFGVVGLCFKICVNRKRSFHLFCPKQELGTYRDKTDD